MNRQPKKRVGRPKQVSERGDVIGVRHRSQRPHREVRHTNLREVPVAPVRKEVPAGARRRY